MTRPKDIFPRVKILCKQIIYYIYNTIKQLLREQSYIVNRVTKNIKNPVATILAYSTANWLFTSPYTQGPEVRFT